MQKCLHTTNCLSGLSTLKKQQHKLPLYPGICYNKTIYSNFGNCFRAYTLFFICYCPGLCPPLDCVFSAHAIEVEDSKRIVYLHSGERDVLKAKNCVPHDLGDPGKTPRLL